MKGEGVLFWTPRALGILFTVFVSIFALDVLGEGYGLWGTMLALLMHLIPALIVLAVLVIAWRWEAVGGMLFIALGVWYVVTTWGHFNWHLVISGPLSVIGGLFLIDWACRAKVRRSA
jgi:hypothetical protein